MAHVRSHCGSGQEAGRVGSLRQGRTMSRARRVSVSFRDSAAPIGHTFRPSQATAFCVAWARLGS